jgi:hypothetical protein
VELDGSAAPATDDDIVPEQMMNDRQVTRSIQTIIAVYTRSKDWDTLLDAIKHALAIVRGGAANFISFVHQVDKFTPLISEAVVNFRSSLVRFACLLVCELAEKLGHQYTVPVLVLIPVLFKPTQNGTQIIADSCRHAILAIARYVPSRKVLNAIIEANASKSSAQRQVVSQSLVLIVANWDKDALTECFQMIERVLVVLLSDPSPGARECARNAFRRLAQVFPERSDGLFAQLDARTKNSFDGPSAPKSARRSASVDSSVRRQKVAQKAAMSATMTADESASISHLQQLFLQGETGEIIEHGADAARRLTAAMGDANSARAFEIAADILHLIPDAFRPHLVPILAALFRPAPRAERLAQRLLARLAALLEPAELLDAALEAPDSAALLHFANGLVERRPGLLRPEVAGRVLALCVRMCLECRREPASLRAAVFLLTAVHDQLPAAYAEFAAGAHGDAREFLSRLQLADPDSPEEADSLRPPTDEPAPPKREMTREEPCRVVRAEEGAAAVPRHPREEPCAAGPAEEGAAAVLERLLARLEAEPDKGQAIHDVAAFVTANDGVGLDAALRVLIRLSRAPCAPDVERALQAIGARVESAEVLDAAIPLLGEEDPEVFIQFLTRVIACATPDDLEPRTTHIMRRLTPLLHHQAPSVRKDSVLCVVEMRVVLGAEFDRQIAALKSLPRKLVLHYLDKRMA